jgi:threonine dehydrogenase-like Zn-dependent dehydrogenase
VPPDMFAVPHRLERAPPPPSPAGSRPRASVAVIGVGALGLAHACKASLMGAGRIVAVDRSHRRLDLAARLAGAETVTDAAEVRGVDVAVNATGFPGSFTQAIRMTRDGGTIIEVGAFVDMGEETFNPAVLCGRNLTMLGIGGEDLQVYEGTLALLARHHRTIPFADMVSHRFAVEEAPEAMDVALDAEASAKVLITAG